MNGIGAFSTAYIVETIRSTVVKRLTGKHGLQQFKRFEVDIFQVGNKFSAHNVHKPQYSLI